MNETHEQLNIYSNVALSQNISSNYIFIQAFAGSGKTTTILNCIKSKNMCSKKILYLSFNQQNLQGFQNDDGNCTFSTIHAIAYNKLFSDKDVQVSNLTISFIQNLYNVEHIYANTILNAYNFFLASTSNKPKLKHIIQTDSNGLRNLKDVLFYVNDLWLKMNDDSIPICHDFYLKKFMYLNVSLDFDYIFIDECQDITPCIMKILYKQNSKKIFVGDIFQQIYTFRNVLNPFILDLEREIHLPLSKSFRFGPDIANLCNLFLTTFSPKLFLNHKIFPNDDIISNIFHYNHTFKEPYTFIARTNKELILKAFELSNQKKTFTFIGKTYDFDKEIKIFDEIKRKNFNSIKKYKDVINISHAKDFFKEIQNYKWISRLELIEEFEINIWIHIKEFFSNISPFVNLITAHQSKGLEFDNVMLANDFKNLVALNTLTFNNYYKNDEYNLIYVSITRTKKNLILNKSLTNFLVVYNNFNISNLNDLDLHSTCNFCGSNTLNFIKQSIYGCPDFVKPNLYLKFNSCLDCVNIYSNMFINNFKFHR